MTAKPEYRGRVEVKSRIDYRVNIVTGEDFATGRIAGGFLVTTDA
jgi:hypothetical protein